MCVLLIDLMILAWFTEFLFIGILRPIFMGSYPLQQATCYQTTVESFFLRLCLSDFVILSLSVIICLHLSACLSRLLEVSEREDLYCLPGDQRSFCMVTCISHRLSLLITITMHIDIRLHSTLCTRLDC